MEAGPRHRRGDQDLRQDSFRTHNEGPGKDGRRRAEEEARAQSQEGRDAQEGQGHPQSNAEENRHPCRRGRIDGSTVPGFRVTNTMVSRARS